MLIKVGRSTFIDPERVTLLTKAGNITRINFINGTYTDVVEDIDAVALEINKATL